MPRRNNRPAEGDVGFSDDLTVFVPPPPQVGRRTRIETHEERDRRLSAEFGRRRERQDRRTDERVARAITDWTVCCIPGCGASLNIPGHRLKPQATSEILPVCYRHQAVIANMHDKARERLARQQVEVVEARDRKLDLLEESDGATQGQIYFVRLNGLIKVGWASRLRSRLKRYGAGVVVLCHYPASRQEETELHRSLRPYLAMGREWYEDCQLINDVIAKVIERHGEPTIFPYWTAPKPDVVCKRSGPLR